MIGNGTVSVFLAAPLLVVAGRPPHIGIPRRNSRRGGNRKEYSAYFGVSDRRAQGRDSL